MNKLLIEACFDGDTEIKNGRCSLLYFCEGDCDSWGNGGNVVE